MTEEQINEMIDWFRSEAEKSTNQMTDEDKNLLPLHPIYFLGSNE